MADLSPFDDDRPDRLSQLSFGERTSQVNHRYSAWVRKLRFILPLVALVMTVIVVTWDEAGRGAEPLEKNKVLPQSQEIQNELMNPAFNSVDDKKQPYSVTAARAVQGRDNPDVVELEKPVATLKQADGATLGADASRGLYEQDSQKLNLSGAVHLTHSDGTVLTTEELRVDLKTRKAYSGKDVRVESKSGTIDAAGLEGDAQDGALVFTGPAKIILRSDGPLLPTTKETP